MARKIKKLSKRELAESMVAHHVDKKLKEKRTAQWVPQTVTLSLPREKGGDIPNVKATINAKYPGLGYADLSEQGHKFVVFHLASGKPIFYNVRDKLFARKLLQTAVETVLRKQLSWESDEASIMKQRHQYGPIVKAIKQKHGKLRGGKPAPGKFD